MNATNSLRILVTRPAHQAGHFCTLLEQAGHTPLRFPTLAILPLGNQPPPPPIEEFVWLIFISANAVQFGIAHLGLDALQGYQGHIAAIGKKTATALAGKGLKVALAPAAGYNTESLLASPQLGKLEGQKILIVKGLGGRQSLLQQLQQRGALVSEVAVYQRVCPAISTSEIKKTRQYGDIDIITLTSTEAALNMRQLLGSEAWLSSTPLLLGSERIAKRLVEAGMPNPMLVASNPSDEAMFERLQQWNQERA